MAEHPRSETIVVGSSPIALLCALDRVLDGHRVTVVERAPRLGGAWAVTADDGWGSINQACHLLEETQAAYDVLAAALGRPLERIEPAPESWSAGGARRRRIASRRNRIAETVLAGPLGARRVLLGHHGRRREVAETAHDLGRTLRRCTEVLPHALGSRWFGAHDLLEIADRFERGGGQVLTDATATHIELDRTRAIVHTSACTIVADEVLLPSGADIALVADGHTVPQRVETFDNHHVAVAADTTVPLSYLELRRHRDLRRVMLTAGRWRGRPVLLVQTRSADHDPLPDLHQLGVVDDTSRAEIVGRYHYRSTRCVRPRLERWPIVQLETYGDLGDNMARLRRRGWFDSILAEGRLAAIS